MLRNQQGHDVLVVPAEALLVRSGLLWYVPLPGADWGCTYAALNVVGVKLVYHCRTAWQLLMMGLANFVAIRFWNR